MSDSLIVHYQHHKQTINLSTIKADSVLFSFLENDHIQLEFFADRGANLEVECFYFQKTEKDPINNCPETVLRINQYESYFISTGQVDVGYFPGKYQIIYKDRLQREKKFFFVVKSHNSTSNDGLATMISRLENLIHSLTVDLLHTGKNQFNSNHPNLFSLKQNLEDEYPNFKKRINMISEQMEPEIQTTYIRSNRPGRINGKSVILSLRKCSNQDELIIRKKSFSYDTKKNQAIKKILSALQRNLKNWHSEILSNAVKIHMEMENSANIEFQSKSKQSFTKEEVRNLNGQYAFHIQLQDILEKYLNCIRNILASPTCNQISDISAIDPSSRRYFAVAQLQKECQKLTHNDTNYNVQYIRSIKLFEYYGFYILNRLLQESGFTLLSSNVKSFLDFRENHAKFLYEGENSKVKVLYGPFCDDFFSVEDKDVPVSVNSGHKSPDYILQFYDRKDEHLLYQVVVETKYIALDKMTKEKEYDIQKTALDYLQLGYLDSNGQLLTGTIKKVILLYPSKQETLIDFKKRDRIYFVGIDIEKEGLSPQSESLMKNLFIQE
jgi:hypothetical protein